MNSFSKRLPMVVTTLVALAVVMTEIAYAHDFWLVPNAFRIAQGQQVIVRGQTSSKFPTSESAVTTDRIREARILGASEDVTVANMDTAGKSLVLRYRPRSTGQRIVAVSLAPRLVRASGPEFKRYMELEGAASLAARYERKGILPKSDSITRRYDKHAKTIIEVGAGGARAFSRVVGQLIEFIPLDDPSTARAGDTLRVRLLFRGQPLKDAHLEAGVAVTGSDPVDVPLSTDANGIARVPLRRKGLWNVRSLHIVPVAVGSGADWDSHFVTLVFQVTGGR